MRNTEFNSDDLGNVSGHVTTADAFFARMKEIEAMGDSPEMCNNSLVASGFPPDMCATAHPENFRNGAPYPGVEDLPGNHPVLKTLNDGIYSNNSLMSGLQEALGPAAAALNSIFSAKASDGYEAPQEEFDISLETAKGPVIG